MKAHLTTRVKAFLSKVLPDSSKARYLSYLPKLEQWLADHNEGHPIFQDRYALYDYLDTSILKSKEISYLELGVYEGQSVKYWSNINSDKNSEFIGFDTFTGLPETWGNFTGKFKKHDFDTKG